MASPPALHVPVGLFHGAGATRRAPGWTSTRRIRVLRPADYPDSASGDTEQPPTGGHLVSKPSHHDHVLRTVDPASRKARERVPRRTDAEASEPGAVSAGSSAPPRREGVQPRRELAQRGHPRRQLLELGDGPGGRRAAVARGARHPPLQHAVALQDLHPKAAALQELPQRIRAEPPAQRVVRAEAAVGVGEQGPCLGQPAGQPCATAPRRTARPSARTPPHRRRPRR